MTPTRRAASITRVPLGTVISMPSIVKRTVSGAGAVMSCSISAGPRRLLSLRSSRLRTKQTAGLGLVDQRNVLRPPMFQRAHDRRDLGISEGTYRTAGDVFTQIRQRFQILRTAPLGDDPPHGL